MKAKKTIRYTPIALYVSLFMALMLGTTLWRVERTDVEYSTVLISFFISLGVVCAATHAANLSLIRRKRKRVFGYAFQGSVLELLALLFFVFACAVYEHKNGLTSNGMSYVIMCISCIGGASVLPKVLLFIDMIWNAWLNRIPSYIPVLDWFFLGRVNIYSKSFQDFLEKQIRLLLRQNGGPVYSVEGSHATYRDVNWILALADWGDEASEVLRNVASKVMDPSKHLRDVRLLSEDSTGLPKVKIEIE